MMENTIKIEWTLDGMAKFFNAVEKDTRGNGYYSSDYWKGFHNAVSSLIGNENFNKLVERAKELKSK